MMQQTTVFQDVRVDFVHAVRKGWRQVVSRLIQQSVGLLSFEEVRKHRSIKGQRGLEARIVSISQTIGSIGRCRDFDRLFIPAR